MLAECGRDSISIQSPVTCQVETVSCKRNFEFVTQLPLFLFDIIARAILFSSRAFTFFPSSATLVLVVWSANGDGSYLSVLVSRVNCPYFSEDSSNLLNDDTYRCVCAGNCVIHPDK